MIPIYQIHPMIVHFPIAILIVTFVCDGISIVFKKTALEPISKWGLWIGVPSMGLAALSGWISHRTVPHGPEVYGLIDRHEQLGFWATGIFCLILLARFLWKGKLPPNKLLQGIYLGVFLAGVLTMSLGAHLGGRLVYEHGVGIEKPDSMSPLLKELDQKDTPSEMKDIFGK
ncbi:MAG: DUF2231 domain-containing protein [Candidatus Margulisiibacteriota bacterium]